jgi:phosphatidylglycerol:prolipoprotein diacylglycerol transferase
VHLSPQALVPRPAGVKVLPTPLWEFAIALVLAWFLWRLAAKARPLGWLTGMYLVLTGVERFLIEFWRINPRLYFGNHFSNAQVAAMGSVLAGILLLVVQRGKQPVGGTVQAQLPVTAPLGETAG